MRVIGGSARGMRLEVPAGLAVRPTSDRLREALFSSIQLRVAGSRWWDVCAGSGAVGIEALSRAAATVVFTESARPALQALRRNLVTSRLEPHAEVFGAQWQVAAARLGKRQRRFDFIYFDPPYADGTPADFLMNAAELLAADGLVLVEHPSQSNVPQVVGLTLLKTLRAGRSAVSFLTSSRPTLTASPAPG